MRSKLLLVLMSCCLLWACSSPINQQNFEQIKNGMSRVEVIKLLGKPTDAVSISLGNLSGSSTTWQHKDMKIVIQFVNDKVILKNFIKIDEP